MHWGEYGHLSSLPKIRTGYFVCAWLDYVILKIWCNGIFNRKEVEYELKGDKDFYISSFSTSVISYKGLLMPTLIKKFYRDLQDEDFKISFCLFHQRFSTNTLPQWKLAQPFRTIAHNGEINSVTANRFNVLAKRGSIKERSVSDERVGESFKDYYTKMIWATQHL